MTPDHLLLHPNLRPVSDYQYLPALRPPDMAQNKTQLDSATDLLKFHRPRRRDRPSMRRIPQLKDESKRQVFQAWALNTDLPGHQLFAQSGRIPNPTPED
jgi:hypothetical protein